VLAVVGCASPSIPNAAHPSAGSASPPVPSEGAVAGSAEVVPIHLPTDCADRSSSVCVPPPDFVDRLCGKPHQQVALSLFAKATPFARLYLRGRYDELRSHEEVLALRYHEVSTSGVRVGNSTGSYDVLRWDGSCSMAVDAEMVSRNRPAHPRAARVQWHRLSEKVQDALVAGSTAVRSARSRRGKECLGAMIGGVSAACERADAALVEAVVDYLRNGGMLPAPETSP